ncbi:DNA-binding response regulator [Pseudonocardia sulfidoxydans NBRC 16205]|uniref:DNA-binding response regulator n=1 Tax=Pseudonocardia sulfidoxydans NBRC 16205 TaxID=1223511 RepID=A0A511DLA2_9PSEU|nr:response regulator transcription factor [Pseudonocardia sulfidoxydans]GEL23848.1 DNA-binding response regulator [Pseudonocardia sulfidoxydans NBRC 16205]
MSTVRVLLVDDHPIVREGMRSVLAAEDGIQVVGDAAGADEAVAAAAALRPDVVLMDLRMPGGRGGVEATADIVAAGTGRVLILTTYDSDADILRAVEAGAVGYLLKDTPQAQLVTAVRAAARGDTVLAPPVAARLARAVRTPPVPALTPREAEVLRAVAQGLSNPAVGRALGIGESTVKSHLLRIFEKLQVDDRTAAVTAALRLGILHLPG